MSLSDIALTIRPNALTVKSTRRKFEKVSIELRIASGVCVDTGTIHSTASVTVFDLDYAIRQGLVQVVIDGRIGGCPTPAWHIGSI